jgi:uncharacterized protein YndB with AHSA1/START domain
VAPAKATLSYWSASAAEGKTTLILRATVGSAPASERDQAQQGWTESFDRLADYLANERTF